MNRHGCVPVPISIRGVVYPSINAAAKAFSVGRWIIIRALDNGALDSIGLGAPPVPSDRRTWVNGVEYSSIISAARAHGYSYDGLLMAGAERSVDLYIEKRIK